MAVTADVFAPFARRLARLGGRASVLVAEADGRELFAHEPDAPMPPASVIKLPLVMALYAEAAAGRLSLDERLAISGRAEGSGVLRHLSDLTDASLRDLAALTVVVGTPRLLRLPSRRGGRWTAEPASACRIVRGMSRRQTRRPCFRTRRLLFFAVFVGVVLVGANFARITARDQALARETALVHAEIAVLEVQNATLRGEIERRKTAEYVVEAARKLGYVRPGEGLATVKGAALNGEEKSREVERTDIGSRVTRWITFFLAR